jgi:hypothetical protein
MYTAMDIDHSDIRFDLSTHRHLSIEEIDMQTFNFMHLTECENEPNHECCAHNTCTACVGDE